jgi:hypothetical protein
VLLASSFLDATEYSPCTMPLGERALVTERSTIIPEVYAGAPPR